MDMRGMDTSLLITLNVLIEECSVSGAAKRLNLSQPAVSTQLKRLRALFNDQLLTSNGRRMVLTSRAEAIGLPLKKLLGDLEVLMHSEVGFEPATASRHFTISMTDYSISFGAGPLVEAICKAAPNVTLAIETAEARGAAEKLEDGSIELIVAGDLLMTGTLRAMPLWEDELVLIQRRGHARGLSPVDTDTLRDQRFAVLEVPRIRRGSIIDDALAKEGIIRRIVVSVSGIFALVDTVVKSDLVAIVPHRVARYFDHYVDRFSLPLILPKYDANVAWHERCQRDAGHQWLRQTVLGALRAEFS